jgi:hypothetical protein
MANIFDYIEWRGDLTLAKDEFNEIDNLILSRFSYFPFDEIIKENEVVTIREISERFQEKDISKMPILWEDDINLFPAMGKSKRFGEMKVTKYVNKINIEEEKQFSAITIIMPDDTIYVSYRGTDNTVIGWKEDLNMTFKSHIPSQIDAVTYLEEIAEEYSNQLRIGGHSKGGNLAVYAAVFSKRAIKNRIINIYNNDGPGFNDEIIETKEYKEMIEKVNTYIPQDSIFGRLLNHEEKYTVVKSAQRGVMQHDLYSWQLLGNEFICLKEVTNGSKFIDKSIKDWLEQIEIDKREQVIDIIFQIINTTNAETLSEIKSHWFSNAKILLSSYKMVEPENKKMILETLSALFKIAKDNFLEEHSRPRIREKDLTLK